MIERLVFVGDVWLGDACDVSPPFWLEKGTVINLESPITRRFDPAKGKICLSIDPDRFDKVFPRAPLVACLANNHIMDHGAEGFRDTINHLERRNIKYYGAGTLKQRCNNPLLVDSAGSTVGLMGYVCASTHPIFAHGDEAGVAPIDIERIIGDAVLARRMGAQRVIVSLHWGEEEVSLPKYSDVVLAEQLLSLGVDLIIGHHPHCRQPVYCVGDKRVFFSLGNAIFPDFEYSVNGSVMAWNQQRWWNNIGIVVRYVPDCNEVLWDSFAQQGVNGLMRYLFLPRNPVWKGLPLRETSEYEKQYKKVKRLAYIRSAVSRFVARPKWPSIASLKSVAGQILKTR